jgi:hypothetical protein
MDVKLDPLTTVVRLALINYRTSGVKVGITTSGIVLFNDTWLDRGRRTLHHWLGNGCSRDFLFALRPPLEKAVLWYRDQYPELFEWAHAGLGRLKATYSCSNVAETLTLAMRTLKDPVSAFVDNTGTKTIATTKAVTPGWLDSEIQALMALLHLLHLHPMKGYIADCIEVFLDGKAPELKDHEVHVVQPTL